jgi:hypothetical protein
MTDEWATVTDKQSRRDDRDKNPTPDSVSKARLIAFYLPQFHPIPENDEWWGRGFTEWTNAAKARPLFRGHYQPHVPADLGFYDLRVPQTREAQAEMARQYGIEGFCYFHYWFAGKRVLEKPFNEVLQTGKPDFPFCLCWANETWTGIWHGCPDRVLIEQTYPGYEDYRAHFEVLRAAFADKRYMTVEGKPIFIIYNPKQIPNGKKVMDFWRNLAAHAGLDGLFLVGLVHNWDEFTPSQFGFDACIRQFLPPKRHNSHTSWRNPIKKIVNFYQTKRKMPMIYSYRSVVLELISDASMEGGDFPSLVPNWDNTPRSGSNGVVLHASTPEAFRLQIRKALRGMDNVPIERKLIFLKSWNEWAEGNHLEPDLKFGTGYLQVLAEEMENSAR